ncbi:MAG TPA: hypothetical protein DCX07_03240 [Phycisphaerales bacterium]|nr:hypothetical protein [Phycisphaerales bacterium]
MSDSQLEILLGRIGALPTLPATAARLLELAETADRDPQAAGQLDALLGADPAIAARLLGLAGARREDFARTVPAAIELLGRPAAVAAAVSLELLDATDADPTAGTGMDLRDFWRHCLGVAQAARKIARAARLDIEGDLAFAGGLLHDLGKLALAVTMPKSYRRAIEAAFLHKGNVAAYEQKILGVGHCVAGRRLAEQWRLPQAVQDVLWLHHQPLEAIPPAMPHRRLCAVVALADALCRRGRIGSAGNFAAPREIESLGETLGVAAGELDRIANELPAQTDRLAELLGLDRPAPPALVGQTLAAGKAVLARLVESLPLSAASAAPARAMNLLGEFFATISPHSTAPEMLPRIGRVLTGLGVVSAASPVAVYSLSEWDPEVLAAVLAPDGLQDWLRLDRRTDAPLSSVPPPSGEEALRLLLRDDSPLRRRLDLARCRHLPLVCAGRWVGGVLAAGTGEPSEGSRAVCAATASALAIMQGRCAAMRLGEQLAGASELLRDTHEALAESRTLAAMGEMAAGAAHEINNPLAVISGRAQLMRERGATDAEKKTWQLIADQAQRISDIITELMSYASPPKPNPEKLQLPQLLENAAKSFSSSEHPQAGRLAVDIHIEDVPPARADRSQMQAVLLELIANAASASREPLQVRLAAEDDPLNNAVLLTVADDGVGMDEKTLGNVFTPFFSVQEAGRRRGLGLPTVKRLVENNGGRVWIRSKPGEGTKVYVQLPRWTDSE